MIRLSCHKRCLCLLRSYITFPIRAIGRKHFVPMRGVFCVSIRLVVLGRSVLGCMAVRASFTVLGFSFVPTGEFV